MSTWRFFEKGPSMLRSASIHLANQTFVNERSIRIELLLGGRPGIHERCSLRLEKPFELSFIVLTGPKTIPRLSKGPFNFATSFRKL